MSSLYDPDKKIMLTGPLPPPSVFMRRSRTEPRLRITPTLEAFTLKSSHSESHLKTMDSTEQRLLDIWAEVLCIEEKMGLPVISDRVRGTKNNATFTPTTIIYKPNQIGQENPRDHV